MFNPDHTITSLYVRSTPHPFSSYIHWQTNGLINYSRNILWIVGTHKHWPHSDRLCDLRPYCTHAWYSVLKCGRTSHVGVNVHTRTTNYGVVTHSRHCNKDTRVVELKVVLFTQKCTVFIVKSRTPFAEQRASVCLRLFKVQGKCHVSQSYQGMYIFEKLCRMNRDYMWLCLLTICCCCIRKVFSAWT